MLPFDCLEFSNYFYCFCTTTTKLIDLWRPPITLAFFSYQTMLQLMALHLNLSNLLDLCNRCLLKVLSLLFLYHCSYIHGLWLVFHVLKFHASEKIGSVIIGELEPIFFCECVKLSLKLCLHSVNLQLLCVRICLDSDYSSGPIIDGPRFFPWIYYYL